MTSRFKGLDLIECLKNYGWRFMRLYRRWWSRPFPRKRNAKRQMAVWRSLTNSWEKKRSKRQRRKRYTHLDAVTVTPPSHPQPWSHCELWPWSAAAQWQGWEPTSDKERAHELIKNGRSPIWGSSCTGNLCCCCFSVAMSCQTLRPHGLQHARLPCPSLSPGVCSNSCPFSWWCYLTISSSVSPFSSCPQSFPES